MESKRKYVLELTPSEMATLICALDEYKKSVWDTPETGLKSWREWKQRIMKNVEIIKEQLR